MSVLLPVRDAGATLEAALSSLARQTLADFEVVAVDDGSVDASGEILDRWAERDRRFVVVHLGRGGLVTALNAGLALCRAPLVARLDGDDVSHPRRLELQAALLAARPEVDVVSCRVRCFPARAVGAGMRRYETWLNSLASHEAVLRERFVESPLAHPAVTLRRAVLVAAGGYRDLGWPEDYDLWLRLAERGARFAAVDRTLLFWRVHASSLTRVDRRYHKHRFPELKAHFLARGPLAGRRAVVLWGAGPTGRRLSRALGREGVTVEAVVDIDPHRVGSTLHGTPIVGPDALPGRLGGDGVVLVAVASLGAREVIRGRLAAFGLAEGRDFWCVS